MSEEPGNDELLAEVASDAEIEEPVTDGEAALAAEEAAVEAEPEATDEPGEEYEERPPAGLDPDTGYDPLPPA
jgi:hypothetical protein